MRSVNLYEVILDVQNHLFSTQEFLPQAIFIVKRFPGWFLGNIQTMKHNHMRRFDNDFHQSPHT